MQLPIFVYLNVLLWAAKSIPSQSINNGEFSCDLEKGSTVEYAPALDNYGQSCFVKSDLKK
jgi:hypothetical protein